MSLVLSLNSNSVNPLRILGPGSDPDNPALNDVIFDANHKTLLVLQKGAVVAQSTLFLGYAGVSPIIPLSRAVTPGRRPIFLSGIDGVPSLGGISGMLELPRRGNAAMAVVPGSCDGFGNCQFALQGGNFGGAGFITTDTHCYALNFNNTNVVNVGGVVQIIPNPVTMRYAILSNTI